jgi:CheY-like chemotaxis protein
MMFIPEPLLAGKRVLIVEDESMVAMLIEGLLEECECSIVGPCNTFEKALEAARTETFDLAVLDVNLRGTMVYPVAELLSARHIPFLFVSGYGDDAIPPGHDAWRVCAKPFKGNDLVKMMSAALLAETH